MSVDTGTLDANSEAFVVSLAPGQQAKVRLAVTGTITVTATDSGSAFNLPSGSNAAWTASDSLVLDAPGRYTFTASGVSGGSCVYEVVRWPV